MVRTDVRAVTLIFDHIKALGNSSNDFDTSICFLHLENLHTQVLNMSH